MKIQPLNKISSKPPKRLVTGVHYFDTLLGGGLIAGSTVLCAGLPGAGKSTLLIQVAYELTEGGGKKVLYVAGEESKQQIKMRAERLLINSKQIFLTNAIKVEEILKILDSFKPDLIIIDSLQTLHSSYLHTAPGTPSQIRYGLMTLCETAQNKNITIIFVGHSTKSGYIAGMQSYQHMVDVTLYLDINEDDTRFIKVLKNRFGPTGLSQDLYMTKCGLFDYPNPDKQYGSVKTIVVSADSVANKTKGYFIRPFALMALEWLKNEAHNDPSIPKYEGTFTLTSEQIDRLSKGSVMRPIIVKSMKWLEKNYG